jgi:hypothetical protein
MDLLEKEASRLRKLHAAGKGDIACGAEFLWKDDVGESAAGKDLLPQKDTKACILI